MRFKVASRVRGLSDEAFREAFGTEEQCRAALLRLRWPDGFLCPCCGHRGHCVLAGRGLYLGGVRSGGKRGRGGQDALRGGGLDQSRGAPAQAEAGAGQGLPQARDRARRQALAGPRRGGCDGRPGLLERTRRDRLLPSGNPHRVGPTGGPHGAVQMGEHDARQHQERDHRDLSQARPRSRRALPRQLRLALQPALSTRNHDPAFRP